MMRSMMALTALTMATAAGAASLSDDELRDRGYAGHVEAGFNKTSGNSNTRGYLLGLGLEQMFGDWRNKYAAETSFKKDSGNTSEERYFVSGQSNRSFTEVHYGFGRFSFEDDRFNGLDNSVTGSGGLGYLIFDMPDYYWDVEAGPGYRYNAAEDEKGELIGRLASGLWYDLSPTSRFREQLSVEGGAENIISRSETSLTASIIGELAMKLSFVATHQTDPAYNSDGSQKKKLDTKTMLTLLYDF